MPFVPDVLMLGQFPLAMVAVLGLAGAGLAYWLAGWFARRGGGPPDRAQDVVLNFLIGSVVSAKLLYVILDPTGYVSNPLTLLLFPYGPLALPAGLVGGAATVAWGLRRAPDWRKVLDDTAAPLALAAAVGAAGWHAPGSWAFAPALTVAGALALALSLRRAPAGHRAAASLLLVAAALALADIARPGSATSALQWAAAVTATLAWLWLRQAWKKDPET